MARTPLARWVESTVQAAHADEQRSTRQAFLRDAGALALAVTGAGTLSRLAHAAGGPRVVVVGGGLAGLTCAYRLKQAGYVPRLRRGGPRRRALLDDPRRVRRRAARGARRRVHRHGPQARSAGSRSELDLELDDVNAAEAPAAELTAGSTAGATARAGDGRHPGPGRIWRETRRPAGYPTLQQLPRGAGSSSTRRRSRLPGPDDPRRAQLEARHAARRRVQHRVRRRDERPERAQLPLPDRLRQADRSSRSSASRTSAFTSAAATT